MIRKNKRIWKVLIFVVFLLFVIQSNLFGLTLTVQEPNGAPVNGYRWLVEKDTTNYVLPGVPVTDSLSVNIHNSYAPVVLKGHSATSVTDINVPSDMRYVVSVLPDADYSISGNLVNINQTAVTVVVSKQPIPTAQITVFAFHDNFSINNAPDVGEQGLEGFSVVIADIAGAQMMDAFGNPVGTTYQQDPNGLFILDPDGAPVVDVLGSGVILTDPNGEATIKYLAPGKYAVQVIPPAGLGWIQTSTIEGTKVIDAWVKANEPPVLVEFGPALYHVFFGFVQQFNILDTLPNPGGLVGEITGRMVFNHVNRPLKPQGANSGEPVGGGWVGLNSVNGQGLYAAPCNPDDGTFTISNVPPGSYQLVTWDENLLSIFGFNTVIIPDGGGIVSLGDVPVFAWFGTFEGSVFLDTDEDGFRDPGEQGIPEQNVNIRFRDGSIYQAQPTDVNGEWALEAVFPFFRWLVAEVDFARFKATGLTTIVDFGGPIPPDDGWNMPSRGKLNPQPQVDPNGVPIINPNTGNNLSRTEVGVVLTEAMQLYAGQTNIFDFGKMTYGPDENGGISGIVFYDTTRAENDPRYCVGEEWQPGIPRVQVNLYLDTNPTDGIIDELNGDGIPTLADVDNYPFGWRNDPNLLGPEDVDRNGNGTFNAGDAIQVTTTDCWDDSKPEWGIRDTDLFVHGHPVPPTIDNFSTWNQAQPGIFDGGYAFDSYFPGGIDSGSTEVEGLPTSTYIIESTIPPGYELVKEEDKNVDFGDGYVPSPQLLPPICVGDLHLVPAELTLFPGVPCFYAGQNRPLADRKQVALTPGKNAAADFFFFTEVPKAARAVGFINNDIAAEFDPNNPQYGEKAGPSWIPISFQNWEGNEVARIYCDEFGSYNALLPSTFSANLPAPSGMSPQMLTFVINHPGPIPDPCIPGNMIIDPYYDPSYSQTAYTFNFMPGTTTYLDTPVIQMAAFVGYPNRKLDVEPANGTPVIFSVMGPDGGPIVLTDGATVTITSVGNKMVPNPDYNPNDANSPVLIQRDFGFGITQGSVTVDGVALNVTSWTNSTIQATVDFGTVSTGTVQVTRGDNGMSTDLGVTLHVNPGGNIVHVSGGSFYPNTPIQDAIDAASNGTLIIIEPGTYWENPIVYKPVTLQGSGAESTIINATHSPSAKLTAWRDKFKQLVADATLPEEGGIIPVVEAPAIMVYANAGTFSAVASVLVDGLTITGATAGGGVYAHGNADYLEVRNNKIVSNQGSIGGGVIIGQNLLGASPTTNTNVNVHHNYILLNGGVNGGGGVTLYSGSTNYQITDNLVMGNFARLNGGAGVSHVGLSDNGLIAHNTIAFNEVAYGGQIGGDGGGVYIAALAAGAQDLGTGSVTINGNLIQGNIAGSGVGGGLYAAGVNGQDMVDNPDNPDLWYKLNIFNNIIVNNVATNAAGGVFLADATNVKIINNTIANNDSAGTGADAFTAGNLNQSNPQPAGLVTILHSGPVATASGQEYTNPVLADNIIQGNRSFYWDVTLNAGQGGLLPNPSDPIWDLAVLNRISATQVLNPDNCLLTSLSDSLGNDYNDGTNVPGNPLFVSPYNNTIVAALLVEEGGNAITTRFNEIDRQGDYHITAPSPAVSLGGGLYVGTFAELDTDYDQENRAGYVVDIGADQFVTGPVVTPVEVIVDNLDAETSSVGVWLPSSASGFWATNSVWANDAGDSFTFMANLVPGVNYAVYEWHTQWPSRYTAAPHQILSGATVLDTINVNQQTNGGQWNLLGIYSFNGPASITVLATPGFSTCADAVRFVPLGTLQSLEITGPLTVNEITSADYNAIAHFDGGLSITVEPELWSVDVAQAVIDSTGMLSAGMVVADTPAVVSAQYTLKGTTVSDTHNITILNSGGMPDEVVVDNLSAATSSVGVWSTSSAPGFWATNSVWSNTAGGSFTFNANLIPGTDYAVFEWHTEWPNRYTAVPYQVLNGATLLDTINVNQQINGGQWNLLGVYTFNSPASVTILATPGFSTCADAVMFVPVVALQNLEITGPLTVDEGTSADYNAIAHFTGGLSLTVEPELWGVDVAEAVIGPTGVLSAGIVAADIPAVVSAQYTLNGTTVSDTYNVTILNSGGAPVEVIVDNLDAATSSVGVWDISSALGFWATNSVWANDAGDSFTFTANLVPGTTYQVYEWHTVWPNRNSAAPHEIRTGATLLGTVNVNQQINGGQWNLLGTYTFTGAASVTVSATPGFSTNADAVRFVPVP